MPHATVLRFVMLAGTVSCVLSPNVIGVPGTLVTLGMMYGCGRQMVP